MPKLMKKKRNQEVRDWINRGMCGLVPIYNGDGGNYTKLIFQNNPPIIVEKRIHTALGRFVAFFQKDIRLIRDQAREITGQRSMNPLPINPDIILVPFRMRKPIGKDDGAIGYFFNSAIDDVIEDDEGVRIALRDGQEIHVLDTYLTAKHHIGYAHQIHYNLLKYDVGMVNTHNVCRECIGVYDQPATKKDFVVLSKNLEELVYKLDKLQK